MQQECELVLDATKPETMALGAACFIHRLQSDVQLLPMISVAHNLPLVCGRYLAVGVAVPGAWLWKVKNKSLLPVRCSRICRHDAPRRAMGFLRHNKWCPRPHSEPSAPPGERTEGAGIASRTKACPSLVSAGQEPREQILGL